MSFKIKREVYRDILSSFLPAPPEQGGILGQKGGVICRYIHDTSFKYYDRAVYEINAEFFNSCIEAWQKEGTRFFGIVHSHPKGQNELSKADEEYIKMIFDMNPCAEKLFFPLVVGNELIVFVAKRKNSGVQIERDDVEII